MGVVQYCLKNTATGFSADGITFEASFNRYITDEEIEDGVSPTDTKLPERNYSTDVTSKAATERATAMAIEADKVEFTDCAFLGSQDTLYTGNSATNMYFKNCRIEGNQITYLVMAMQYLTDVSLDSLVIVQALLAVILQHTSQQQQLRQGMCLETVQ